MLSARYREIKDRIAIDKLADVDDLSELLDFVKIFPAVLGEVPDDYMLLLVSNSRLSLQQRMLLIIMLTLKLKFDEKAHHLLDYMLLLREDSSPQDQASIDQVTVFLYLYFVEMLHTGNLSYSLNEYDLLRMFGEEKLQEEFRFILDGEDFLHPKEIDPDQVLDTIQSWTDETSTAVTDYVNLILNTTKLDLPQFSRKTLHRLLYLLVIADPGFSLALIHSIGAMDNQRSRNQNKWTGSVCKILPHISNSLTEKNIQQLKKYTTASRSSIRVASKVCLWMLTGDVSVIEEGLADATTKKEKEAYSLILDDLDSAKQRNMFNPDAAIASLQVGLNDLSAPKVVADENVVYLFRSTGKGKLVAVRGDQTLAHLHSILIDYYDLESMHLYGFYMDSRPSGDLQPYSHPYTEGPNADEVTICELKLYIGQTFLLIHDYGDYNKITLEFMDTISPETLDCELPAIISKSEASLK